MKDKNFKFYVKVVEALLFTSSEPVKNEIIASKLPDTIEIDIIMNEMKERARIENPELYKFAYIENGQVPELPKAKFRTN